ncbi:hypothetical protein [Rasiella sp. SM2506]|uniref:hypothetical protein n=1 Tax=Rasiella sp. SM2506 TaxID=3423914 RepID=UPI003D7C103B
MFKRVVSHKGFWKSVAVLSLIYMAVLIVVQGISLGFSEIFLDRLLTIKSIVTLLGAGVICGFAITYAKFWRKLKEQDYRK